MSTNEDNDVGPWNPNLRKIMTGVASLGALETAYLTASKLSGDDVLCAVDGSCQSVLNSPYAIVPFTNNVPLAAVGVLAYTLTALVAIAPILVDDDDDDVNNRTVLLFLCTALGTFSTFLMWLLYGVLHQSCPYCVASATLSWTLCATAWWGGALPQQQEQHKVRALQGAYASALSTAVASVVLFASVSSNTDAVVVSSADQQPQAPPTITTKSSPQALALAKDLESLHAKMYGAFWCSHCYDQKQSLGQPAFRNSVQYVECSKDGVDSQAALCKERNVPGYPTWEIDGQLFPGEQELEELQEIVQDIIQKK